MRHNKNTKAEAAARIRANEAPLLLLAREYGVSTNTLRAWLREFDQRNRAAEDARRVATSLTTEQYSAASQRERLLMHALEYSPATIIVTDAEGRIVYANPKFVATTGYAIADVIGQTPRLLKSGETSPTEYKQLWKSILAGKEWRGTFHNRRKNGDLYWERASISPVFDDNGKISNFMAVKEDITDFMEADLARRRTAAGFMAVIAALPCALIVVDHRGVIQIANQAAETTLGVALPQGMHFDSLALRWSDEAGAALSGDHPLPRVLAGEADSEIRHTRVGIVSPNGAVRQLAMTLRSLRVPETGLHLALLILE